jgi:hypothetical protein
MEWLLLGCKNYGDIEKCNPEILEYWKALKNRREKK